MGYSYLIENFIKKTAFLFGCVLWITRSFCDKSAPGFDFVDAEDYVNKYYKNTLNINKINFKRRALPNWMLDNIEREFLGFTPFSSEDLEKYFFESIDTLVHFRIRNGKLFFRHNDASMPGLAAEYATVIYKILMQPDCRIEFGDFLMVIADGVGRRQVKYPVFCFSKFHTSNYISIPDPFAIWVDKLPVLKEVDRASKNIPWEKKNDKAFWIGSANGGDLENPQRWMFNMRARFVLYSLENPDIVWARFTHIKEQDHICKEMKNLDDQLCFNRITPFDSCCYKYLLDIDGVSSAWHRCHWVLRSNCVPLKQDSGNFQWYYSGLKPYVHYVPIKEDCSDLRGVIEWLKENDNKAKEIALNGREFAIQYLDTNITYLYLYHVLKKCSQLNYSSSSRQK